MLSSLRSSVWLLLLLLLLVLLVQLVVLLLLLQMAAEPQHFQFLEGVKSYTKHVEDHIKGLEAEVLAWKKRCAVVLCVETAHACSE